MSDLWVNHYLFSLVKDDEQFRLMNEIESATNVKEKDQYFIKVTSTKEESSGLESGQPKIFVIKSENKFTYVGYSSGELYSRITRGLADSLAKTYIKNGDFETKELDLYVFEFAVFADYSKTETRQYYQSIQSELIFLIKYQTGLWPILQKQVNLSNDNQKDTREIAVEMFEKIS